MSLRSMKYSTQSNSTQWKYHGLQGQRDLSSYLTILNLSYLIGKVKTTTTTTYLLGLLGLKALAVVTVGSILTRVANNEDEEDGIEQYLEVSGINNSQC